MHQSRPARGFTLLEMLVVLLLIGMAAALAAPMLLRTNPARSGFDELIAIAREAAVKRGEVLYLRVSTSGQWSLEAASAPTADPLASGHVGSVGGPFTLMISPNGSCMFDVPTVARGTALQLDPLTCEVQPSTVRRDSRAGVS
ncbi:MAG TPA: prepilin-type N-terminal cleavage/methylation domain-containing protein [Gemmatimonadales bacterium]|jgi:prepilin-type N-terminal cleavage/methylation domain-containing protein|nr:prepilin-type N-terminal cleavage/methylation domain-containing protein [Gemmatimonadales bacterium]